MEGKHAGDMLSVGVAVLTLANWLPAIAAVFTIIWTGMRIMEGKLFRAVCGVPERVNVKAASEPNP